jgi:6-phosphogluconolactonase
VKANSTTSRQPGHDRAKSKGAVPKIRHDCRCRPPAIAPQQPHYRPCKRSPPLFLQPHNLPATHIANMPKPPNLYAFEGTTQLAAALRTYVLDAQNSSIERHSVFRVAVSGGSLPKVLGQALLKETGGDGKVQFDKWEIYYADERAVPLDHEDSNHRLVQEELLNKIPAGMGKPQVFPIDVKYLDDVQELADQYEQTLVSRFAAKDSVRIPIFDLILLGCGPDGHTCSLFPGSPLLRESDAWILPISDSPKPPPKRITLSLPVASHGLKIGFVATGAGKKEVLKQIFDTEEGRQLPCGLINENAQERVSWFVDYPAVEGVSFPARRGSL